MNKTLLTLFLLLPFIAIADEKIGDQIRYVDEQDKAMSEAIQKAKNQLDGFLEIAENPPIGASDFKLKVMISDSNGVEHLWFTPFKEIEGGYAGVLANEPGVIKSAEYGRPYAFKRDQITDWGYVRDGKQIGSFTICALFKTMNKDLVEQYKNDHGFTCNS